MTPNTQIEPAMDWLMATDGILRLSNLSDNTWRPVFLIGSDYNYPRTSNKIIRQYLADFDVVIAGEVYVPLTAGSWQLSPYIVQIIAAMPNGGVIINTLNGIPSHINIPTISWILIITVSVLSVD
jgi:urea transport system substrate-binding protein